jgi:hypothetical protein
MVRVGKKHIFLIVILLAGFVLRVWGVNFGLPYQFHQDEPIVVNHALAYGTGDLNPHFFAIPPLVSYFLFFIYAAYFLIGKVFGLFVTSRDFALAFLADPSVFYILGRIFLGVIPGTLCIMFTYKLYKSIFPSTRGALFSSAVIAFSFLNVADSHYIYTDMLMSLFIILTMMRIFFMYKNPTVKNYVLTAVMTGITASIKYNAVILLIPVITSHLLLAAEGKGKIINKKIIFAFILTPLVFFITNPFALLDCRFFINSLTNQAGASGYTGFFHHIKYSLSQSLGPIMVVLGFAGFFFTLAKNKKTFLLLYSFPVIFYLHLIFLSQPFPRYVLPLIPFFAIASGWFLFEYLFQKTVRKLSKVIIIVFSFLLFVPMAAKAIYVDKLFTAQDTRIESADWIKKHLNADARIAVDSTFFRPAIEQNITQIKQKYSLINNQQGLNEIKSKKIDLMLNSHKDPAYYIYFLSRNPAAQGQFFSTAPAIDFDIEKLKENNIEYVVVNYAARQMRTDNFYSQLKQNSDLVVSFSPYKDNSVRFSYDMNATTSMPVVSREIYSRAKNGPALEIYRLK